MTVVRVLARPLLASSFVLTGLDRLRNAESTGSSLRPTLDRLAKVVPAAAAVTDNEKLVAQLLGATQVGAAAMLAIGRFSRLAAVLLVGTSAVNTLTDFNAADSSTPAARKDRRNQLLKNLSLIGAVLIAAVDTNGRPGLAWRAEHFASGAKRNAKAISYDTRRNARSIARDTEKQLRKADKAVRKTAADVVGS
ncbi:DoxX family protein [Arthrobacter sp. H5]|uniref:DoxX family protein n=1 Tax=Arthrobacter sp. H5 TaxID=1267973 RepID=UPI0004852245|nr:DoxX family protein [Arthrobacter sp. H5]